MSKTLRQLERESGIDVYGLGLDRVKWEAAMTRLIALALEDANNQLQEIKNRINILEAERMEHAALIHSDKGYTLGTLADADAFAERRRIARDIGDCV
jgi:signal transduction histidine kinase